MSKRRNICGRPGNTAKRTEERTSLILVFGRWKLQRASYQITIIRGTTTQQMCMKMYHRYWSRY